MKNVFIIAEAGVNHNGSVELAKKLIDVASEAGVDAVKFQTFKTENLVSKNAQKADYQKETTDTTESQYDIKNLNSTSQHTMNSLVIVKQKISCSCRHPLITTVLICYVT